MILINYKKVLLTALFLILTTPFILGQVAPTYNLKSALEKAVSNYYDGKLQELAVLEANKNVETAKKALLPNVSAFVSNGMNFGRSIDPYTNEFTNKPIYINSFAINTNATLFNGNRTWQGIQHEKINLKIEKLKLEEIHTLIQEEVLRAYTALSLNLELVEILEDKLRQTNEEISRNKQLIEHGIVNESVLSELESEKATQEINLLDLRHNAELASLRLNLLIGESELTPVVYEKIEVIIPPGIDTSIYSIENTPTYKISNLVVQKELANLKIVRSYLYPSLSLQGTTYSGYSNGRLRFDKLNNTYTSYPFSSQLKDNISQLAALNLEIPIFNKSKNSHSAQKALIRFKKVEIQKQQQVSELKQKLVLERKRVQLDHEKVFFAEKRLEEMTRIFINSKERFDAGRLTAMEYIIRKNQLLNAQYYLAISKFSYFLNSKLLEQHFTGSFTLN